MLGSHFRNMVDTVLVPNAVVLTWDVAPMMGPRHCTFGANVVGALDGGEGKGMCSGCSSS